MKAPSKEMTVFRPVWCRATTIPGSGLSNCGGRAAEIAALSVVELVAADARGICADEARDRLGIGLVRFANCGDCLGSCAFERVCGEGCVVEVADGELDGLRNGKQLDVGSGGPFRSRRCSGRRGDHGFTTGGWRCRACLSASAIAEPWE